VPPPIALQNQPPHLCESVSYQYLFIHKILYIMKKYFWQLTSLVLAAMLLYSFAQKNEALKNRPGCEQICTTRSTSKPFRGIHPKLAFDMIANYKTNRHQGVNIRDFYSGATVRQDSRSVWFSLETLKQFLFEIESNTCGATCSSSELGVRIYFGVYPNLNPADWTTAYDQNLGGQYGNLPKEYTNLQTVVMVPTVNQNGLATDFDYRFFDKANCRPQAIDSVYETVMKSTGPKSLSFLNPTQDVSTDLNHGTLKPPPYDDEDGYNRLNRTVTRPCNGTLFMNFADNMPCGIAQPLIRTLPSRKANAPKKIN
jgi:hypothetical protein